ncbi:MAG: hypothetical protein IKF42_13205 [Mogibacterium sp.]|nr:hypothetical protein [Mogibacterium sp.]
MEKLRTIEQTIAELRAEDPGCQLTDWALRQLVREGAIPSIKIGKKSLLSIEAVERYVNDQLKSERIN